MNRVVPVRPPFAALVLLVAAASSPFAAAPARAQFLGAGLERTMVEQRLRQPALRLATLGRLSLALDDENNEINQWDFGNSTVGLLGDREGHALDLFVDDAGRSNKRTVGPLTRETERVDGSVFGLSAVARNAGTFAFGIDAGFQTLGTGIPRDPVLYSDDAVNLLDATVTAGGRVIGGKLGWGARLGFGTEKFQHRLRDAVLDGDELELGDGDTREPISIFELTEGKGRSTRLGLGVGWLGSSRADVSLNWDYSKLHVTGDQNTRRRIYETEEKRGIDVLSLVTTLRPTSWATFGGVVGSGGYDVDETYRFSLSLGQGAPAAMSRGLRYSHHAEGEFLKARVALAPPAIEALLVGADFNVRYGKEESDAASGPGSFNDFLDFAERNGFILGPQLYDELDEVRHWDGGVGLGYAVSPRLRLGVEGHRGNDARDGTLVRTRRRVTDLRAGVEYDVSSEWQARLGGWRRGLDEDVYTRNNEGVAAAVTLGAGYHPTGSKWAIDAGAEILDRSTDYPDPNDGTGSGFRFVLYNRWAFR